MTILETNAEIIPKELERTADGRFFMLPAEFEPVELPILDAINISGENTDRLSRVSAAKEEYLFYTGVSSKELSANDAVNKQLALVSFNRDFIPLVRDRDNPIVPDGMYWMGSRIYLKHQSGLYAWGPNWFGVECFRVIETIGQLQAVQAGELARMAAAEDILKTAF